MIDFKFAFRDFKDFDDFEAVFHRIFISWPMPDCGGHQICCQANFTILAVE
jgi:hypothetical protein